MTSETTVSVIVPCFNAAAYLTDALNSIFDQSVPELEVIVVDDGSTDDSSSIAATFGDRIRYERQQNQGISAARNTGLRLSNGGLIAFLDADDIWPERSLRERIEALRKNPGIECVFGAVEQFISPELSAEDRALLATPPDVRKGRLAGSMLITRAAFEKTGYFDSAFGVGETMDWVARSEQAGVPAMAIDNVVLRRRIHSSNSVRKQEAQQRDYLRVLKASIARRRQAGGT
jgi:glycosyltransferase involved in cell wall biosynthesis